MKKYTSILWVALCLGFVGNVAWGQDVNENQDVVSGDDTAQLMIPGAVNATASEALSQFSNAAKNGLSGVPEAFTRFLKDTENDFGGVPEAFTQFLQAAKNDLSGLSASFEGVDLERDVLWMNALLGQPFQNATILEVLDLKKYYYDESPLAQYLLSWVQYSLVEIVPSSLYEMALTAYFVTGEHYWIFFPALLAECYSKGLINMWAMNAIADYMSHKWVPGGNSWIDAMAKALFYRVGINYMKDSNLSTLVSQMTSDAFAYASSLLATEESES